MAERTGERTGERAAVQAAALVAAVTLAAVPWAGAAFVPAHRVLARVLGQGLRLVGHNDWSYAASMGEVYAWLGVWLGLAALWAAAALRPGLRRPALAGLGAQLLAGVVASAAVALVEWGPAGLAEAAGPGLLRVADLGSPWFSCPAVLLAAAWWETASQPDSRPGRRPAAAGLGYAVLLAALLVTGAAVGAGWLLLLAAVAATGVLPRSPSQSLPRPLAVIRRSRLRVARWMRGSA
ncbi:hypothetical protein [Phaeacidiphilus oryzae]|uniref:hypothetical protein n=1 Tax=Phaeacidiphilus oryzae TaxID=348818 RepID=UPI00056209EA|nr:hypothetical protein [Phaeacidiphilus oryzae]